MVASTTNASLKWRSIVPGVEMRLADTGRVAASQHGHHEPRRQESRPAGKESIGVIVTYSSCSLGHCTSTMLLGAAVLVLLLETLLPAAAAGPAITSEAASHDAEVITLSVGEELDR